MWNIIHIIIKLVILGIFLEKLQLNLPSQPPLIQLINYSKIGFTIKRRKISHELQGISFWEKSYLLTKNIF